MRSIHLICSFYTFDLCSLYRTHRNRQMYTTSIFFWRATKRAHARGIRPRRTSVRLYARAFCCGGFCTGQMSRAPALQRARATAATWRRRDGRVTFLKGTLSLIAPTSFSLEGAAGTALSDFRFSHCRHPIVLAIASFSFLAPNSSQWLPVPCRHYRHHIQYDASVSL